MVVFDLIIINFQIKLFYQTLLAIYFIHRMSESNSTTLLLTIYIVRDQCKHCKIRAKESVKLVGVRVGLVTGLL